jgi:hypothetical protein
VTQIRHPQPSALVDAAAFAVISIVAAVFASANLGAPVQRDGAHFVFMAINIAAGQPPYWASFETKNPLVEYVWASALALSPAAAVPTFRLVEHAYLALTAALLYGAATRLERANAAVGAAAAALYLCAALDWRVSDDGFNIALYQSLPELVAVWAAVRIAALPTPGRAMVLGVACFFAWFTKQTSLVALAFPVAGAWLLAWRVVGFAASARALLTFVAGAVVPLGLWFAYLAATDTLGNYVEGTMAYRIGISPLLWADLPRNFVALFTIARPWSPESLAWQFHKIVAWCLLGSLLATPVAVLARSRRGDRHGAVVLGLAALWFLGTFVQAIGALTFFRHYFLACLAPLALVAAIVVGRLRLVACTPAVAVSALVAAWSYWYLQQGEAISTRARNAPMTLTVARLRELIPPGATVFNWNGLPHFHAYGGKSSDYPFNLWWPWIRVHRSEADRDARLRAMFRVSPPDRFLEIFEKYPAYEGLEPIALTPELLARWTGRRYELAGTVTPPAGRYGVPARVFARVD